MSRDPYAAAIRALEARIAATVRATIRYGPSLAECDRCTLRRAIPSMGRCQCGCARMLCRPCRSMDADFGPEWR